MNPNATLRQLRARRTELLRQSWEMVCTPMPSGEQAGYAFDEAHAEVEREIADVERQIKVLCGQAVGVRSPADTPDHTEEK